jgi:hypothetical protein
MENTRRPGDTSAAIAANRRRGLERKAELLRAAGYIVVSSADVASLEIEETDDRTSLRVVMPKRAGVERHTFDATGAMVRATP